MGSILTNTGRIALAVAVKNSTLHLAWGRGQPWWDAERHDAVAFVGDKITLSQPTVTKLVVKSADGTVTFTPGVDYTVNALGVVTRLSGGGIGVGATVGLNYVTPRPPESPARATLFDEIGRKKVTDCRYVVPDDAGEIEMTSGRFSYSDVKTRHLLFRTAFSYSEGADETIREVAVMLDTVVKPGTPPGKYYLTADDILDPGDLLLIQYTAPTIRNGGTAQSYESVLTL